jgi:hypothetical protein
MRFCDRCRRCGGIASHADFCEHAGDTRFDAIELPDRKPDALPRRMVEPAPRCCECSEELGGTYGGWVATRYGVRKACAWCYQRLAAQ